MSARKRTELAKWIVLLLMAWMIGVMMAPHCYNASQALADLSGNKQTNVFLRGLCNMLASWHLSDFLIFSEWLTVAGFSLIALRWLQSEASCGSSHSPANRYFGVDRLLSRGQPLLRNPMSLGHVMVGMGVAGVMVMIWTVVAMMTTQVTWHQIALHPQGCWGMLGMLVGVALSEVLLRGVLLGILLRHMSPMWAIVLVACLGSVPHASFYPIAEKRVLVHAWWAGFEWHGRQFQQIVEAGSVPLHALLLLAGLLLGWLRYRGASLALPLGLHLGWSLGVGILATMTASSGATMPPPWMLLSHPSLQGTALILLLILAFIARGVQGGQFQEVGSKSS